MKMIKQKQTEKLSIIISKNGLALCILVLTMHKRGLRLGAENISSYY